MFTLWKGAARSAYVHAESRYHIWGREQDISCRACLDGEGSERAEKNGPDFVDSSSRYNTVDPR